jgi:hypothetical protein
MEAQKEYEAKYGVPTWYFFPSILRERGIPSYRSTPEYSDMIDMDRKNEIYGKSVILVIISILFSIYTYSTLTVEYEGPYYLWNLLVMVAWFIFICNRIWNLAGYFSAGTKVIDFISDFAEKAFCFSVIASFAAMGIWIAYNLIIMAIS